MNQMTMMGMNHGTQADPAQQTFARPPTQIYQPTAIPQYHQGYSNTPQQFGGRGGAAGLRGGGTRGGRARRGCGRGTPQGHIPTMLYVGGTQLVPYVPGVQQQSTMYSNKTKYFSNQNVCFSCGFALKIGTRAQLAPLQETGSPGRFHTCKLHAVRTSRVSFLQESDAQDGVPVGLTVWGSEDRY